jgi:hypothetical protein
MAQITAKPNLADVRGTVDVQCDSIGYMGMIPVNISLTPAEVDRFIVELAKARDAARRHNNPVRPFWK